MVTQPVSTRVAGVDGVQVAVHRWSPDRPADGLPPVVLQHGFVASTHLNWVAPGVVAALLAAGRDVVGVDARGHGSSDAPHDPARYGEAVMARDLALVADELGLTGYDLVGYSMGAVVALLVAGRDRRVRRLAVGGVGAGVVELGGLDTRAMPPAELVVALETDEPATLVPGPAAFRRMADAVGADRLALAAHARVVHAGPVDLAAVTAPALLLAGDVDPLAVRPHVLADALPRCELVLVPGDHGGAVSRPEFAAALVAHLSRPEEQTR